MSVTVVVGAQWGDEAKGKIIDFLAERSQTLIRYGGGGNAGHTVQHGTKKYKFHHIPSGILNSNLKCCITANVVIDIDRLLGEIDSLLEQNISLNNLYISPDCHLVMPFHKEQDSFSEKILGNSKIGTTGQGIGPVYADKALRVGVRIRDLLGDYKNNPKIECWRHQYAHLDFNLDQVLAEQAYKLQKLTKWVRDPFWMIRNSVEQKENVIIEGAQGTFLDINYGEYPYVTSSSPISGGACLGTAIGPRDINHVIGVVKAYSTRVGSGPMPTVINDELAAAIRVAGNEFGTTTGRPRRIGWPDLVALKYSMAINSIDTIAVTLLDVLSGISEIKICTSYLHKENGTVTDQYPKGELEKYEPLYKRMSGWSEDITLVSTFEQLPKAAQDYLKFISSYLGKKVEFVSVGPAREQTIHIKDAI